MVSAEVFDVALCELSECEGIPVVPGFVDGGRFFVVEAGFFTAEGFLGLAFDVGRGFAVVFFGGA